MSLPSSPASHRPETEGRVQQWSMGYPMVYSSVALTRRHALRRLAMWGWAGDTYDAVLIVSELVSNAINHGRRVGHELRLRLCLLDCGTLIVEVSDPVAEFPGFDRLSEAGEGEECGRGLLVVRRLGGEIAWLARPHVGKTVRVFLPGHPSSA